MAAIDISCSPDIIEVTLRYNFRVSTTTGEIRELSNSKLGITKKVMLKPRQLSAALKLLDWTADDLARESRTSRHTIFAYISRGSNPKLTTVEAWIHALHKAGVVLFDEDEQHGLGVRLRKGVTFPVVPTPPPGAKAKARGRKGSS